MNRPFAGRSAATALALLLCVAGAAAQERAVVAVARFSAENPLVGDLVTEAMRTGLAGDSFLQVVEAVEADAPDGRAAELARSRYLLDGSVSQSDGGLTVAYRLVETATGRVLAAGNAALAEATFEQDLEGLSAALGNTLLAAWAGSTGKAVAALIASGRFDEAGRRLDSLSAREPDNPSIPAFRNQVARGRADAWKRDAAAALEAARKAAGFEALRLAERARDSLEAALLLMPAGSGDAENRATLASMRSGPVEAALERGRREAVSRAIRDAEDLMAAGQPEAALESLRDFRSLFGDWASEARVLDAERRAAAARGRQLAAESSAALARGELEYAAALASRASEFAPGERSVQSALDRAGAAIASRDAADAVEEESRWDLPPEFTAAWRLSAGVVALGYRAGDFSLPLDGVVPGVELGLAWRLELLDGPRVELGITAACAGGGQELSTWGEPGSLEQTYLTLDAGAEFSWPFEPAPGLRLAPGLGARLGAFGASWSSSYPGAPQADRDGLSAAPSAALALFVELDRQGPWSFRVAYSMTGAWIFGFGPVGGTRLSASVGLGLD